MLAVKVHRSYRVVVGMCDLDLVGKKFEEGKRQLDLRANFYKEEEMEFDKAVALLKRQALEDASFNIVGEEAVKAAIKAEVISEEIVDKISGIPFALTLL
jgi:hypothetical protein